MFLQGILTNITLHAIPGTPICSFVDVTLISGDKHIRDLLYCRAHVQTVGTLSAKHCRPVPDGLFPVEIYVLVKNLAFY